MNASQNIDIGSEVGTKLAKRAAFDRIQSCFRLHAGKLVKDIRRYAAEHGREDVAEFALELRGIALLEFERTLEGVHGKLVGSRLWAAYAQPRHKKHGKDICMRFNLIVPDLADGAADWCEALEVRHSEFVPTVRPWVLAAFNASFDKALELLLEPVHQS